MPLSTKSRDSSGVSFSTSRTPTYVEAALSIFDRPRKPKDQTPRTPKSKHIKTVSTDNLLKKQPSTISSESFDLKTQGDPWTPGFIHRLPYTGVLALLIVLLCASADAIILYLSHGQPVDTWKVSPSVLLAILSSVANVSLAFARSQGVVISWWRKALRGGTLYDLSRYWESGDSLLSAATCGRDFNVIALATVVASAIVLDGPLLQRASSIVVKQSSIMVNVRASIAQEIPYGYTGFGQILEPSRQSIVMQQPFAQTVQDYANRQPITTEFTGCLGNCSGTIKAAGLTMNCTEDSVPWILNDTYTNQLPLFASTFGWRPSTNLTYASIGGNFTNYRNWFDNPWIDYPLITFDLEYMLPRNIPEYNGGGQSIYTGTPTGSGRCNGTLARKRCSLRAATLEYPITMSNNTVFLSRNTTSYPVTAIQTYGNLSNYYSGIDLSPMSYMTLGGVALAAQNLFGSSATQPGLDVQMIGSLASQYANYGEGNNSYFFTQDACAISWTDPTADIIDALNEIMFRTSLVASNFSKYTLVDGRLGPNGVPLDFYRSYYEAYPEFPNGTADTGLSPAQNIQMRQDSTLTVFHSNYSYLAAALGVMVLGVLVVVPTFHGFWELGRETSLNPLEIAKAFNADMLWEQGSNRKADSLAKDVKNREVKYGEVVDEGVDDLGLIHTGLRSKYRGRRLELADPSQVREPRVQEMYM